MLSWYGYLPPQYCGTPYDASDLLQGIYKGSVSFQGHYGLARCWTLYPGARGLGDDHSNVAMPFMQWIDRISPAVPEFSQATFRLTYLPDFTYFLRQLGVGGGGG